MALSAHPRPLQLQVRIEGVATPAVSATVLTAGFLVAAGDSWFDYPFYDVLKLLEDHYGYNIESAAHRGDPIEAMAYFGGQLDNFSRGLGKVLAHGAIPKAVLLSGGGDDIAGDEFGMLLNSEYSPIAGWNDEVLDGVINKRISTAYVSMLTSIDQLCVNQVGRRLPILVHGYDYPVPDGRGFFGGWGPLPGPWLEPGFREKGFKVLADNTALMRAAIDRFNEMLISLTGMPQFAHVHYVNLRGTLATGDNHKDWWGNELHPTEQGFQAVTDKFAQTLNTLP